MRGCSQMLRLWWWWFFLQFHHKISQYSRWSSFFRWLRCCRSSHGQWLLILLFFWVLSPTFLWFFSLMVNCHSLTTYIILVLLFLVLRVWVRTLCDCRKKNSKKKIKEVEARDLLVNFIVVSLFINVQIVKTSEFIKNIWKLSLNWIYVTRYCVKNTHWITKYQQYKQKQGAPLVSPLSLVLAKLFMMFLEIRAINSDVTNLPSTRRR